MDMTLSPQGLGGESHIQRIIALLLEYSDLI